MARRSSLVAPFVVLALALGVGACSDDDEKEARRPTSTTASTAPPGPPTLGWAIQGVEPHGTQPPAADVLAAVQATLDGYLAAAVVAPLYSGTPAGDLTSVLSAAALERLAADPAVRATLIDEGMPPATTSITAEIANASLSSVAGPDGYPALIGATLDLKLHAVGPAVNVDIVRQGDVVLVPEPAGWRIDSFQLRTQRDTRDAPVEPTTTAKP